MIGDKPEEEYAPDAAVVDAKSVHDLFGQVLRPFSFSRKLAAQAMGCLAPHIPDFIEHMKTSATYPGALRDTMITLWLCTLKDNGEMEKGDILAGEFTPERALAKPQEALAKAEAWAEANGFGEGLLSEKIFPAWTRFLAIMFGISESLFEIKSEDTAGLAPPPSDDPKARPGNPRSHGSSRGLRAKPATRRNTSGKK